MSVGSLRLLILVFLLRAGVNPNPGPIPAAHVNEKFYGPKPASGATYAVGSILNVVM